MIKHKQLIEHNPPDSIGDCLRTVFACLLDYPCPSLVPHFTGITWDKGKEELRGDRADNLLRLWLTQHGLALTQVPLRFDTLSKVIDFGSKAYPKQFYLLSGISKNHTGHIVICLGKEIYWDPSRTNSGIEYPFEDLNGDPYFIINTLNPFYPGANNDYYQRTIERADHRGTDQLILPMGD